MPKVTEINFTTKDLDLAPRQMEDGRYRTAEYKSMPGKFVDGYSPADAFDPSLKTHTYRITQIVSGMHKPGEERPRAFIAVREDQRDALEQLFWANNEELKERVDARAQEVIRTFHLDLNKAKASYRVDFINNMAGIRFIDRLLWAFGWKPTLFPRF